MRGTDRHGRAISLDEVFEAQRTRVRARLARQVAHCRQRLEHLGLGGMDVEVRGTSGGGPSLRHDDERVPTSERRLYGAW